MRRTTGSPRATRSRAGAALLATAALLGCGTTHTYQDPGDTGLIETDHVGLAEIEPAVKSMCDQIARANLEGWPDHVQKSTDTPPKPQIVIDDIQNRTRVHFDVVTLKNELTNELLRQRVCYVVGNRRDLAAVNSQRSYSESGAVRPDQQLPRGAEDASGLVLIGEITDDVIEQGDVKQHDFIFSLRLQDTVKNRTVAMAHTKFRKVRERGVFGG